MFGYYIEISKANLHAVPDDYQRKQTIAGGERFTTPALKEYEEKVLGADERILERELEIFEDLRRRVAAEAPRIQDTARALATLDVLAALAETAAIANYTKPHLHDGDEMIVTDGRHPVVERYTSDAFVPNDIDLNGTTRQLVILTGPNMGGKSTYLRQTALIPLLAQIGSFVPAKDAKLPIVDRIFARVGAADNIARGQSTFMVEMQETANILHTATSRSLVVLDEIGRGTSTFDGLSIAWAVAEYLATNPRARPKTLFATHYHELTDLADALPGRRQRARLGARVEGRHHLPAEDRQRPIGSQLRDSGRAAGWPAGHRRHARAGDPQRPRARRAVARRPSHALWRRRRSLDAPARPVRRPPPESPQHRGACRTAQSDRHRRDHAKAGARTAGGIEEARGQNVMATRCGCFAFCLVHLAVLSSACRPPPPPDPNIITIAVRSGPTTLDPRQGTDESSQRVSQLMFNSLMEWGDDLRVHPALAERLENPDPVTYVAHLRRGVRFHDGHELTSRDVVYTFPAFARSRSSCRR